MDFILLSNTMPEDFIGGMLFIIQRYWPMFLEGIKNTLIIALSGTLIGLILAIIIAPFKIMEVSSRDSKFIRILKKVGIFLTTVYVEVLRGTPMIIQSVIIFYGLAGVGVVLNIILCGILIVSINTSAYIIEVLRGSINAIEKGQMEAARSLGMSRSQAMRTIIIPQAIKNSIPAIGNEFVINIKDTAVLSVIAVTELFFMTKSVAGIHFRPIETYSVAALIYLTLTFTTTRILYFVSDKLGNKEKKSYPTSQTHKFEVKA